MSSLLASRRRFLFSGIGLSTLHGFAIPVWAKSEELRTDVVIIGGGLGGCAAAIACLRNGLRVIITEPTEWLGGQMTSQGVPPDEHAAIETHGANQSYRDFRSRIREYYRRHYRLTDEAKRTAYFNPGRGSVSRLCCEPRVAVAVLEQTLQPYLANGQLQILRECTAVEADCEGDRVRSVRVTSMRTGDSTQLVGKYIIDATELGDLLPLTKTEFVSGAEAKSETNELHAAAVANPDNQQAFTVCFAIEYDASGEHVIDQPSTYDFWRRYVPALTPPWSGRLLDLTYSNPRTLSPKLLGFDPTGAATPGALNLWNYRRIIDRQQFAPGQFESDISLVNWPQNDYLLGNLVGVSPEQAQQHVEQAKQLSFSLLYWLQTEAPRSDGKAGFPGLRLRSDLMGTADGMAMSPYIRESRRIRAEFTVLESHVGKENRQLLYADRPESQAAERFPDSVGVGSYPIDLHPTSTGDNYIDFETYPFQIPLGSLLPIRVENLLPACKNIGTTHLTSGCYRLHPVEWGIGEAVGCLISYSIQNGVTPRAVQGKSHLERFQSWIIAQGVEIEYRG